MVATAAVVVVIVVATADVARAVLVDPAAPVVVALQGVAVPAARAVALAAVARAASDMPNIWAHGHMSMRSNAPLVPGLFAAAC